MVPVPGNWFDAQQLFNARDFACSAGQSIGEYCSAVQDQCCAVCPNAPITGPGTLIIMSLGAFANLLFVLWYQSEAPYNLAYQLVATDGALFGEMNRLIQDDFRLSEFHYYFIPLAIMSCMPLALAACLCDVPSLHSMNPSAQEILKHATWEKWKAEERERKRERRTNGQVESSQPLLTSNSLPSGRFRRRRKEERENRGRSRDERPATGQSRLSASNTVVREPPRGRPLSAIRALADAKFTRRYLIITAWCFFTAHLIAWPFLFAYVYFINDTFNQPICGETFDLQRYRYVLGGLVGSWLLFTLLVWILFTRVLFFGAKKRDMIETIGVLLHLVSTKKEDRGSRPAVHHWFDPYPVDKPKLPFSKKRKARGRSILRWALSIGCYWIWLAEYLAIYFIAVRDFVLIGTNGFDFGQIVAVIGIIIPIALIARANFDYDDAWKTKRSLWEKKRKNDQAELLEDQVDPEHPTLPGDWNLDNPASSHTAVSGTRSTPRRSHRSTSRTTRSSSPLLQRDSPHDESSPPRPHARHLTHPSASNRPPPLPQTSVYQGYHGELPSEITKDPPTLEFRKDFEHELSEEGSDKWLSDTTKEVLNPPRIREQSSMQGGSQQSRHASVHRRDER